MFEDMFEENNNRKKGKRYLVIGIIFLSLALLGTSVAYYLARVQGNLSGRAAGTGLSLTINKVSDTDGDLIPLDNDVETLNKAILGYGNTSNNFDSAKACLDINNYSVCQVYKVTLTNNGTVPVVVNSKVELSGANTPNIDCTTMDDEKSVSNNNSCIGNNTLANNDTINGNKSKDYYVVVYINNLDEPQYDSGEFNGTVTFTSTQGDQVKGRFKKGDTLVEHITKLYTDNKNTTVTNNNIEYQYATSVNLMNDRLGGTTEDLDGGNIRYYGANPNNYIDIGDHKFTDDLYMWQEEGASSLEECVNWGLSQEYCATKIHSAGAPILWRIIGVFDGKVRIRRDENIGVYLFDTSAQNVNDGQGINQWGASGDYEGADLMKLLNPGYENNLDKNYAGEDVTVNNSLYWTSGSGNCYDWDEANGRWGVFPCDFTNSGLSDEAKEYVVDQTLYLGGFDTINVFANQAWEAERGNDVFNNTKSCYGQSYCNDTVERTLTWTGKVGLIYPSDFGYAADFSDSNCQGDLRTFYNCTENWMAQGYSWTVSPWASSTVGEFAVYLGSFGHGGGFRNGDLGGWPVLTLDSSVLAETGNGSKETPYVLTS